MEYAMMPEKRLSDVAQVLQDLEIIAEHIEEARKLIQVRIETPSRISDLLIRPLKRVRSELVGPHSIVVQLIRNLSEGT